MALKCFTKCLIKLVIESLQFVSLCVSVVWTTVMMNFIQLEQSQSGFICQNQHNGPVSPNTVVRAVTKDQPDICKDKTGYLRNELHCNPLLFVSICHSIKRIFNNARHKSCQNFLVRENDTNASI